jgi:Amt family ammonium transporter
VTTATAVLVGVLASLVCYYAIYLKTKLDWDDALDVWGVHGVGGMLGVVSLGLFAWRAVNPEGGADGLFHGDAVFFVKQVLAVVGAAIYAFLFTYLMLFVIDKVTPVKLSQDEEDAGLDETLHGEAAYL